MVYQKRSMRADAGFHGVFAGGCLAHRPGTRMIGAVMVLLFAGSSVFADVLVQPMIVKKQVQPGKRINLELRIENISPDVSESVTFRIAELTQDANGVWEEPRPDDPNLSALKSCKSWIQADVASAQLDPYQQVPLNLLITVPGGTRGYYFAALIAETLPPEQVPDGVEARFSVQYLVPIILECQGLTPQAKIALTDVHLTYVQPTVAKPAPAVISTLDITNNGGTYSRLLAQVRVWHHSRGYWRKVADLTLPETGIIPSVKLHLKQDIGTVLPDGKYKVEGYLYVDGRRGNAISKEFDFKGDPTKTNVRTGAPIDLDKRDLFVDVIPGSTRTGTVLVGNGSEEEVTVQAEVVVPPHMVTARSGVGIVGEDLSCVDWVTVNPSNFTLGRYGRRNLMLVVRTPNATSMYSHYYATVLLHVTYPDGSSGGQREIRVCVNNSKGSDKHHIDATSLRVSEASPSRYFVAATFLNQGATHVKPVCNGLLTEAGAAGAAGAAGLWKKFLMTSEATGQTGVLLPFESRAFQGVLDISGIPNGVYRLTADLQIGSVDPIQGQQLIRVYSEGSQKKIEILPFENAPDGKGKITIQL